MIMTTTRRKMMTRRRKLKKKKYVPSISVAGEEFTSYM